MRSFSAHWLALREPLDAVSRDPGLGSALIDVLRALQSRAPLQVIDLGAGCGANLRHLAPMLCGLQYWILVDRDPVLLDAAMGRMQAWTQARCEVRLLAGETHLTVRAEQFECHVRTACLDLATQLERLTLPNEVLLSGSALLDLVSESWLRRLAQRAASAAASVWFALIYDGRIACTPADPEDLQVRELFNRHQRTDKGFGAALGPTAAQMTEQIFVERGYRTWSARSDWHLGPQQPLLQHALVDGMCEAACEIAPGRARALRAWRSRRRAHIEAGRSQLIVGHVDLVGSPRPS